MNDTTIIDTPNVPPEIDAAVSLVTAYFAKLSPDGNWQYRGLASRSLVLDNDWQPISTAPTDGAYILTWSKKDGRSIMYKGWASNEWLQDGVDEEAFYPTHWMPLPKPPQVTP